MLKYSWGEIKQLKISLGVPPCMKTFRTPYQTPLHYIPRNPPLNPTFVGDPRECLSCQVIAVSLAMAVGSQPSSRRQGQWQWISWGRESVLNHIHTYVRTYVRTYTTYVHTYVPTFIHTYIHPSMHAYIHSYIHTYIHPSMHTYIRTYIHSYIHTYIRLLYFWSEIQRNFEVKGRTVV